MRRLYYTIILTASFFSATASHITGGEMYYTFTGLVNGQYQYAVTLKLFQRCGSGRLFPNPAIISIFDKTTNARVSDLSIPLNREENIFISNPNPCITNPPTVCYDVAYYTFTVSLPASAGGYIIASQVNFRISGISNLRPGYSNIGATYTTEIPGTANVATGFDNNSAKFTGDDLVIVCANNDFTYSFGAIDPDGDVLRYSFCDAYTSSNGGGGSAPTNPPPFSPVDYNSPTFTSTAPLGNTVQINPTTGLVSGIAPASGTYVITVCVEEIRNGVVIATQRKDLQINIADCDIAAAILLPEYQLCKQSKTITLANISNNPLISTTNWEISNSNNSIIFNSTIPVTTYTFADTGIYHVKLIINQNQSCTDSTTSLIRVYPGFQPDFSTTGICISKLSLFTDKTSSVYGIPNSWNWDFGETTKSNDTSIIQNPAYTYPTTGIKNIRYITTDSKGCRDTIIKSITIIDKPLLSVAFTDTLICSNDKVTLLATGMGNFKWSPQVSISNPTIANPIVNPVVTTTYIVELDDNGCKNSDTVKVNVVNFVTLIPMNDTVICSTDTIQLNVKSDGLQYSWSPAAFLSDPLSMHPFANPSAPQTTYTVTAKIGSCTTTKDIIITTVPYPFVDAGPDFSICYNNAAQLNGTTDGNRWSWNPVNNLFNATQLNPTAYPVKTTSYVLTAFDMKGCPKPSSDTVTVTVIPKINVTAGNDTAVVINQPLQLLASGGISYQWSPPDYLSATTISNPVAIFQQAGENIRYKVIATGQRGCKDSAFVNIKIYQTKPTIFVPTGFTPNNDGRNDKITPIAVGIQKIEYFNIYNRWGQLLFTTSTNGQGWDGRVNGVLQSNNTFVWIVKAIDFTGASYFQKGLVTLIR